MIIFLLWFLAQARMEEFEYGLNPSILLLTDWFSSSHNTPLSLEMVVSCLEELKRSDVIEIIREEEEEKEEAPQVFISYQWDHQVIHLTEKNKDFKTIRTQFKTTILKTCISVDDTGLLTFIFSKI